MTDTPETIHATAAGPGHGIWTPEVIYLTEVDYEDPDYPLVWASISGDSGGTPYRRADLSRPEDAERIAELEAALHDGMELIRGESVGADWKRGCAAFLKQGRAALRREGGAG
jgi:hypothetical protein